MDYWTRVRISNQWSTLNPKSSYNNRDAATLHLSVCPQGETDSDLHNTISHHRHTHTRIHRVEASLATQSLSNKERTDAPSGSERGGQAHCVCVQWAVLAQTPFLQSQAQQCPSMRRRRKIPTSSWCKNMTAWHLEFLRPWGGIQKKTDKLFLKHLCPLWVGVQ